MLNKSELSSLHFVISHLFVKMFIANNIEMVVLCHDQFGKKAQCIMGDVVSKFVRSEMPFVN